MNIKFPNRSRLHVMAERDWYWVFLALCFFWLHRSQQFAGDGELLSRITEGGKWLVENELLSQAAIQLLYRLTAYWHWTPMEAMNVLSCLGGALSVWMLLRFARRFYNGACGWPMLLFVSSGFLIYSCGHTEYYPLLLPALFLYGYGAIAYLRGEEPITLVVYSFLLATALHFAMLIALPSLLLLPFLRKNHRDYRSMSPRLVLFLLLLFLIRNHSQFLFGHKASGLSPAWNPLPLFAYEGMYRYYAFFDWRHLIDWLYGWIMRSWIFWPMILWQAYSVGVRSLFENERLFLLVYTLCFTLWSLIWHPDLGMLKDWDLFAIEAAPCLLLLITYLPVIRKNPFRWTLLATAAIASALLMYSYVLMKADFPRKGYGSALIHLDPNSDYTLTIDGLNREVSIPRIREGIYNGKLIDRTHRRVHDFHMVIQADHLTQITFSP
ncbi:MAG: hypothetical protein C4527_08965 [Candidatus Omnitrophota bacterium]|jgi:hypothetical protein|nr:MAG: hypothetical protein C4527_08965 [Candidatus Omnitrophota bacterium]